MISSDLLTVRAVREADLPVFFEHLSDMQSLGEFLPVIMPSETQLRQDFAKDGLIGPDYQRYLIVAPDGEMLGYIWAFKSVPYFDATEIGYQIFSGARRGKGYASEALRLFRDYLFEASLVNRLELRIAVDNTGSLKVAEKLGFTREGVCREAAYSKGRLHDMCIYAQLRREWQAHQDG